MILQVESFCGTDH